MQRYLLVIQYMGTAFIGWQRQRSRNYESVQGVIEAAVKQFIGSEVSVVVSSRTDAGVNALRNTAHIDLIRTDKMGAVLPPLPPQAVRAALNNNLLEHPVAISDVYPVSPDFSARFCATKRRYVYRLETGCQVWRHAVFSRGRSWMMKESLDVSAMKAACEVFIGKHDFTAFRSSRCQAKSPVKRLQTLRVEEVTACFPGLCSSSATSHQVLHIVTEAPSFLYNQVRLIVATLVAVGRGQMTVDDVKHILHTRQRSKVPALAPAEGLYLDNVMYEAKWFQHLPAHDFDLLEFADRIDLTLDAEDEQNSTDNSTDNISGSSSDEEEALSMSTHPHSSSALCAASSIPSVENGDVSPYHRYD
eukprot:GILK01010298.1.p1 GENE.GILK01010298.1~~GILK01010298.1.p1  ORF type:complete len:360 (-),score=25.63 GILK01010298.1:378-1457(-)